MIKGLLLVFTLLVLVGCNEEPQMISYTPIDPTVCKYKQGDIVRVRLDNSPVMVHKAYPSREGTCQYRARISSPNSANHHEIMLFNDYELFGDPKMEPSKYLE